MVMVDELQAFFVRRTPTMMMAHTARVAMPSAWVLHTPLYSRITMASTRVVVLRIRSDKMCSSAAKWPEKERRGNETKRNMFES